MARLNSLRKRHRAWLGEEKHRGVPVGRVAEIPRGAVVGEIPQGETAVIEIPQGAAVVDIPQGEEEEEIPQGGMPWIEIPQGGAVEEIPLGGTVVVRCHPTRRRSVTWHTCLSTICCTRYIYIYVYTNTHTHTYIYIYI